MRLCAETVRHRVPTPSGEKPAKFTEESFGAMGFKVLPARGDGFILPVCGDARVPTHVSRVSSRTASPEPSFMEES